MAIRDHKRQWRQQRVSSGANASLFFIAFLVGTGGVFWFKSLGFGQLIITSVPIATLVLYATMVVFLPLFRLRSDQAGDNCYYLGFLYTLVSLSRALAAFVGAGGTEKIVEEFGIALASTIIGLMFRVMFSQMRQEPIEVEREARLELASAAQRLRAELDQVVIDLNSFRRATQQSVSDGLNELSTQVNEMLGENLERYDEITLRSAERIHLTLDGFAKSSERLGEISNKNISAIELLTERIEAIKAPEDLVEARLLPAADAIAEMVAELRKRAGAESSEFTQLRKMIEGASAAASGLEGEVSAFKVAVNGIGSLTSALTEAERRLEKLTSGLSEAGQSISAGSGIWREVMDTDLARVRDALKGAHTVIDETSGAFRDSLIKPAEDAGGALKEIARQSEGISDLENQLKRLSASLEEQIETLARMREEEPPSRRMFGLWSQR